MASYVIRRGWFGWGGFVGRTGVSALPGSSSVVVSYSKALRAGPAFAQFTATVDGVARAITAASVTGSSSNQLSLTFAAPALVLGQDIVITYTPGGTPATRLAYASPVQEFPAGSLDVVVSA